MKEVHNPQGLPDPTLIDHIEEPYIRATVITAADFSGPIMTLCLGKRGELVKQEYISGNRMEIVFDMPLGEIVIDFYDKLKRAYPRVMHRLTIICTTSASLSSSSLTYSSTVRASTRFPHSPMPTML